MKSSKKAAHDLSKSILKTLLKNTRLSLEEIFFDYSPSHRYTTIYRLKKRGLIESCQIKGIKYFLLTKKGRELGVKLSIEKIVLPKAKDWDNLWRFVIFDIPETQRYARRALHAKLRELGFENYQKSVLIYPFECRDEIEYICEIFNIRTHIRYLVAKEIDDQEKYLRKFRL